MLQSIAMRHFTESWKVPHHMACPVPHCIASQSKVHFNTGYATIMIMIWPVGVPLLYAYSFWLNWPTIGRLRRAEMRMEAATSVRQLRRASVNQAHL